MKTKPAQKNIPEGWNLLPAGDVFTFVKSYAFSRDNLVNDTHNKDGIGNIHYGDIHSTFSAPSIDLKKVSVPMVKDASFTPKPEDLLKDGDLIMADASEDYAGVGVTVSLHGLEDKKVVGGLHTFVLRDTKNKTDKYFRQYIFRNPEIRNSMQKIANGVSVYGISKTAVSKLLLPIPPLSEQKRIVSVLGIWDNTIEKLKKKILHKKELRKVLRHQILSGHIVLSGHKNEWETVKLGDVSTFVNGYIFKSSTYVDDGQYKVITIANVQDSYMVIDKPKTVADLPPKISKEQVLKKGDILISMTGNVGRVCLVNQDNCLLNQRVGKVIPKNIDRNLLYMFLQDRRFLNEMIESAQGGAQDNLSSNDIKNYTFKVPKSKDEQNAVARILMTADKEIIELENKLALLTDQKSYLLNNLITGTIRTPETLSTHK